MATFLHTADVHLDSAVSAHLNSQEAELRREEFLRCMSGIIDMAKELDFLLIAGDLFETNTPSERTVAFLKRRFAEIPQTKVVIAAGNHDFYSSSSVYAKESLGENVYVLSTEGEVLEFPEHKIRIFGASFLNEFSDGRLYIPSVKRNDGFFNILLLHADMTNTSDRYNPIDKEFISKSGADYAALGHIHKRTQIERIGETYFSYCGAPEGRGFDECGELGCYIVNVKDGAISPEFKKTCVRRMFKKEISLEGVCDNIEAEERIKAEIEKTGTFDDMYKFLLTGRVQKNAIDERVLTESLKNLPCHIEIENRTMPNIDIDVYKNANNLCGEFFRIMESKINVCEGEEKLIAQKALSLGLSALLGGADDV